MWHSSLLGDEVIEVSCLVCWLPVITFIKYVCRILALYNYYYYSFNLYFFSGVNSQIQFQPDTTQHCNGEPVEYQCSIDALILTWRVLLNNGTQFGTDAAYIIISDQAASTIGDVFIPERLSAVSVSPLVSNISFTAQSNINGYTILCIDGVNLNNENVTITGIIIIYNYGVNMNNINFTTGMIHVHRNIACRFPFN